MITKNSRFVKSKIVGIFLLAAICFFSISSPAQNKTANPDFKIQKIASDIYAVIRKEPPSLWFNPNTVFIIGKRDVIVIDANISSAYMREVLAELRKITGKPVRYVINTHLHEDHIIGNRVYREAFPAVKFISSPRDVEKAAKDFPDLNFLIYHAGFKGVRDALPAVEDDFKTKTNIPWITDLCEMCKRNPKMKNVYMDLGTTFGMTAITQPKLCAFMLGQMLDAFGEDHVLWGTDSIWWGSPQWQIEAFRRLRLI